MSTTVLPRHDQPEEGSTAASSVNRNKNQSWYQNLCRPAEQRARQDDSTSQVFPSPQRLQLQLHFQREYQKREELKKNCRQAWWQRKLSLAPASPSPCNYRIPSPAPKYHGSAPVSFPDALHPQATPNGTPQVRVPPSSSKSDYRPPAADVHAMGLENRRRMERDVVDSERETMIKTAQVIKFDAEKRIRQAKREMAIACDRENAQHPLMQQLKEQDLAQKLKTSGQNLWLASSLAGLSADLEYELATLQQKYRHCSQQMLAIHERKWQEQIATYRDMLQEYRQGNFYQSHQKAKRLLQLMFQKEPIPGQVRLQPQFYPSHPQQQTVYQQLPNYVGNAVTQPFFKTPQVVSRSRRDPRLNRSSQQYQTPVHDITPRLNQSSCQYSEQDITSEIIHPENVPGKSGVVRRRNSTPRKQSDDKPTNPGEKAGMLTEVAVKRQSQQQVKPAENCRLEQDWPQTVEPPRNPDVVNASNLAACDVSDKRLGSKGHLHDWEQLQQRSRRLRRGRGLRRCEEEMENGVKEQGDGRHQDDKTSTVPSSFEEEKHSKLDGHISRKDTDIAAQSNDTQAFPEDEAQQGKGESDVRTETQLQGTENVRHGQSEHQVNSARKYPTQKDAQKESQSHLSGDAEMNRRDKKTSMVNTTAETNSINGTHDQQCVFIEEERTTGPESLNSQGGFPTKSSSTRTHAQVVASKDEVAGHPTSMDDGSKKISNNESAKQEQDLKSSMTTTDALKRSLSSAVHEKGSFLDKQHVHKDTKEMASSRGQVTGSTRLDSELTQERSKMKVPRPSSEPPQQRNKRLPPPRPRTPWRGLASRVSQPPPYDQHSQRALRSQPLQRTVRQSPVGSESHTPAVSNVQSTARRSHRLTEAQHSQTEVRSFNTRAKSLESGASKPSSADNVMDKSQGTKVSTSSATKQPGRRSPGTTYVVRNSGQRFASKSPAGAPQDKAVGTRGQGSNTAQAKNTSPKSSSRSPPEPANKSQVSPPSGRPRRRQRRKPWSKEDTDACKETSRSSSAPRSQSFQESHRDQTPQSWHTHPPGRKTGSRHNWESQPRRRPYQWDDSKNAPVRKWRAVGQQGGTGPAKHGPEAEQLKGLENKAEKSKASAQPLTPIPETGQNATGNRFENVCEDQETGEQVSKAVHEDKGSEDKGNTDSSESDVQGDRPSEIGPRALVRNENYGIAGPSNDPEGKRESEKRIRSVREAAWQSLGTEGPTKGETGKSYAHDGTRDTGNKHGDGRLEEMQKEEHEAEENLDFMKDKGYRGDSEESKRETPTRRSPRQDDKPDAPETGFQSTKDDQNGQSDPTSGRDTESDPTCGEEVAGIDDTVPEGVQMEVRAEKTETLLEHVLAVLGRKAAREAEEEMYGEDQGDEGPAGTVDADSDDASGTQDGLSGATDGCPGTSDTQDTCASQSQVSHSDAANTRIDVDLACVETDDGVEGKAVPSSALCETALHNTDEKNSTENSTAAPICPAKLLVLEDMEDWQSLEAPGQEKVEEEDGKPQPLQVGRCDVDENPEKTTGQELSRYEPSDQDIVSGKESSQAPPQESPESCLPRSHESAVAGENESSRLSSQENAESFAPGPVGGQKEMSRTAVSSDSHQGSGIPELNSDRTDCMQSQDSSSSAITTSLERSAPENKVIAEAVYDADIPPGTTCVMKERSDLPSSEVTGLNQPCPPETQPDQKTAMVEPLTMLAQSVAEKFGLTESLPTGTPEAGEKFEDSAETSSRMSTDESSPVLAKINLQLHDVNLKSNTTSPVSTTSERQTASTSLVAMTTSPVSTNSECETKTTSPVSANSECETKTTSPVSANSECETKTTSPVGTNSECETKTTSPVDTNSECETRTTSPVGTNTEYETKTTSPVSTNSECETKTTSPVGTNSECETKTTSPVSANSECETKTTSPVSTNSECETKTTSPVSTNGEYETKTTSPVSTNSECETKTTSPVSTNGEYETKTTSPVSTNSERETKNTSPVGTNSECETKTTSPVSTNGEYETVADAVSPALGRSMLIDKKKVTSSVKKKSVSFADLLDRCKRGGRADVSEECSGSGEGRGSCGVRMKSPPAESSSLFFEDEDTEIRDVQTTVGVCSVCGRWRAMDSSSNSSVDSCQVLLDKLTAFGYV